MEKKRTKTGGRKKSSLNKIPKDLRLSITEFLQNNFEEVVEEWQKLESTKDKLTFFKDLLKFAVPALQSTELKVDFDKMTDEQLDQVVDKLLNQIEDEKKGE